MNCQQFESRIQNLLDQRENLLDASELQKHANECNGCDQLLKDYCDLDAGLNFDRLVPTSLSASQFPLRPRSKAQTVSPLWIAAVSAAAAILIWIGFGSQLIPTDPSFSQLETPIAQRIRAAGNLPESVDIASPGSTESIAAVQRDDLALIANDFVKTNWIPTDALWTVTEPGPKFVDLVNHNVAGLARVPQMETSSIADVIASTSQSELPVLRTLKRSVYVTLEHLQRSLSKPTSVSIESSHHLPVETAANRATA